MVSQLTRSHIFKDAHTDQIAQKCLEAFASYGIKPPQIIVRSGDQTFNHDLSFSLFNGNGTFRISSEKLEVSLQNATSAKDFEILQDCVAKIYEHVSPLPEIGITNINAMAHATFASTQARQEFFSRYINPEKQIILGGTIAYIRCEDWPEEIRFMIDKSLSFSDGIFLVWTTAYRAGKISRNVLKEIQDAFEESAAKLNLTVPKTN